MTHSTHHSLKQRGHRDHAAKVSRIVDHKGHGERPATKSEVKTEIKSAMKSHDKQQHGGKHTRLAFAAGGAAGAGDDDAPARPRLDRPGHKRGGPTKGKKGSGNHVNVIIAGHGGGGAGGPPVAPPGAMGPKPPMPPAAPPPMAPPGAGGPPGAGAMPPRPPMAPAGGGAPMMPMRAAGGRTAYARGGKAEGGEVHLTAGSKSGIGRLEKEHAEAGRKHGENLGEVEDFEDKSASRKASVEH